MPIPLAISHSPAPAANGFAFNGSFRVDDALPITGWVSNFGADRQVYGEGDDAALFFKVVAGVVRTCKFRSDGCRQIEAFSVAGELFGFEIGTRYRLSAEAVCDCTLISYDRADAERRAARDDTLVKLLFSHAMRNMVRAQDHALLLGRRSAAGKVAAFLIDWAQHSSGAGTVTLEMTRQDIADYLGLTIETVSRTLSQLERDAVIAFDGARLIRFTDAAELAGLTS